MIIGIDASRAITKQRTGTEKYSRELIFELAKFDHTNSYKLYVGPNYDGSFGNLPKNFQVVIINRKKFWTQVGLSLEMIKNKPDVLFVPSHILPLTTPKQTVTTIHDFGWKYFPDAYSAAEIKLHDLAVKRAIKKKSKIIVYSKSTLADLNKFYNPDHKLIEFVPMGFKPENIIKTASTDKIKNIAESKYILFVGRIEQKKNISNLVSAYEMLRAERKIKHKLILVGKPGFGYEHIKKDISKSKFGNDIFETGYISDDDRDFLYQNADIFVLPSFFEGFGYPILEAFAAGIPVVTSNISSMPEVAGKAALFINPKKPFEITAAISQVINKPEIRNQLIKDGMKELAKFSWPNCAKDTLNVLEGK